MVHFHECFLLFKKDYVWKMEELCKKRKDRYEGRQVKNIDMKRIKTTSREVRAAFRMGFPKKKEKETKKRKTAPPPRARLPPPT